jgi:hypothetical protein
MSPSLFFLLTLAVTAVAMFLQALARRGQRRRLRELADEWKMHYSPDDRFQLSDRVVEVLPVPGAARVRVSDLIYGNENNGYRYFFAASFTEGVIRAKRRGVQVATFHESRDRDRAAGAPPLMVADNHLPVLEQYRELYERISKSIRATTGEADESSR